MKRPATAAVHATKAKRPSKSSISDGEIPSFSQLDPHFRADKVTTGVKGHYDKSYELSWFFSQHQDDVAVEIPQWIDVFAKKKEQVEVETD
jgi:hypothetical protein